MNKTITLIMALTLGAYLATAKEEAKSPEAKAQTLCPVMGGKIDKSLFTDVKGYRVYVCCGGCIAKIKADPDKYLNAVKANGETPAIAPAVKDELKKENKGNDK